MKSILINDRACNYELAWQESPQALIIRMHRKVVTHAGVVKNSKQIEDIGDVLNTDRFCPQLAGPFGFEKGLLPRVANDGFIELEARLPNGKSPHKQLQIRRLVATLKVLFTHLNSQDVAENIGLMSNNYQLLTINLKVNLIHQHNNRDVYGEFGDELLNWLATCGRREGIEGVSKAMHDAFNNLNDDAGSYSLSGRVMDPSGFLLLSGDNGKTNFELRPKTYVECRRATQNSHGCEFGSYNIQTDVQQLTLLAGLARLHDLAREDI